MERYICIKTILYTNAIYSIPLCPRLAVVYFEAKKVLKPLGAEDLCLKYPKREKIKRKTLKGILIFGILGVMHNILLKHFGPWEAWQSSLITAWSKPYKNDKRH